MDPQTSTEEPGPSPTLSSKSSPSVHGDEPIFDELRADINFEEQRRVGFAEGKYFPVEIGQVFQDRYQVLGKLGFGAFSTVWLANDRQEQCAVVCKVFTSETKNEQEVDTYMHLSGIDSEHPGRDSLRTALCAFKLKGPKGDHWCMVQEPMWGTYKEVLSLYPDYELPEDLLKDVLKTLFVALDYLHTEAHMIHTDISAQNMLSPIMEPEMVANFVKEELTHPSPRKDVNGHTVYRTRVFDEPAGVGLPVLSDFGAAVSGDDHHDEDVQPNVYRAPEVCLKAPWSYSIDIWNVGCMIWDLFEGKHLFDGKDFDTDKYMTRAHLAEMIAVMGPPPQDLLDKGQRTKEFFDESGQWKLDGPIPREFTLEWSENKLQGENREAFLRFIRKMITWRPEDRHTARQLLDDDWLNDRVDIKASPSPAESLEIEQNVRPEEEEVVETKPKPTEHESTEPTSSSPPADDSNNDRCLML